MAREPNPYLYVLDEPLARAEVLERLASMPARLREAVAGATDHTLLRRASADDWSAFETFQHVRDAALVYSARFRWMVFDDDPLLMNYDENAWVAAAKDVPGDVPAILNEIAASRADLVRVLSRLTDEEWRRTGRHEVAGPVVLEDYVRHQVAHEAMHLEQIRAALTAG